MVKAFFDFFNIKGRFFPIGLSFIIALFAVFAFLLYNVAKLPDNLYILANTNQSITTGNFLNATIEDGTVAVMNQTAESIRENITNNNDLVIRAEETNVSSKEISMDVSLGGFKVKKVSIDILPDMEVVPCGLTVGIKINTDGIIVLGTGAIVLENGTTSRQADSIFKAGDILHKVNGDALKNYTQIINLLKKSNGEELIFEGMRNGSPKTFKITPAKNAGGEYQLGIWLRDSTQGIGTLTYYNPETLQFGALGHGILDVDTKKMMTVRDGIVYSSKVKSIKKGKKGSPGEIIGEFFEDNILGNIKSNTSLGLFGYIDKSTAKPNSLPENKYKIALQGDVHEGPAKILSNVSGEGVKEYYVYIESINKFSSDSTKGMVVRITDQELLTKTNGIIQGMSGSPIIQDNKLIGAITHVFVQNPAKGYGIFIENMIKNEKQM